jgi:hypothetical protein
MNKNALIGYTGFVGSTLMAQAKFSSLYRSNNIDEIRGKKFDTVVCAGAPGLKWKANTSPDEDKASIFSLIRCLEQINCKRLILISTVDVFSHPLCVNEDTVVEQATLNPYGLHRRILELFVAKHFEDTITVRLPGLVGPGLRKNVIFDLKYHNNLAKIDPNDVFQFYPIINLWKDINVASELGIDLIHLTAEPISVDEVALEGFGMHMPQKFNDGLSRYDFQTRHASIFGATGLYQYSKAETLAAVRRYARAG